MNGIYLSFLLDEIRDSLIGLFIDDVRIYRRMVQLILGQRALFVSLFPEAPALYIDRKSNDRYERHTPFTRDIRSRRIAAVKQCDSMPVVTISFDPVSHGLHDSPEIVISLYRDAPNFSIKKDGAYRHLFARYIQKKAKKPIAALGDEECRVLFRTDSKTRVEELIKDYEGVDRFLAEELTVQRVRQLQVHLKGAPVRPRLVSVKPLHVSLYADDYIKIYDSFNTLLKDAITKYLEEKEKALLQARQQEERRKLQGRLARLKKNLLSESEIERYRMMGALILGNLRAIPKGATSVTLHDLSAQEDVTIDLDPRKTPQQNAQLYFAKYKKTKRGQPRIRKRIKEFEQNIKDVGTSVATGKVGVTQRIGQQEKALPFRVFHLRTGSIVFVGKSARSNEELTFHYTKSDDYFFHVRGYEGSHVILRSNVPRTQKPSKDDIKIAAATAVYFSKARSQRNVAVSYTQRKYIKKSRKGKAGSVVLMREQVVFVDPELPEEDR